MNTLLATYTDGSVENVADAINALANEKIDLEDYKALQTDHYFYFYVDGNGVPKIVYMDAKDNVVYPENEVIDGVQLMSLSGSTPESDVYTSSINVENNTTNITISNGAELTHLMNNIDDYYQDNNVSEIKITLDDDVDLRGSTVTFDKVSKNLTFDGKGKKVSGGRTDRNSEVGSYNNQAKNYGYGLFNIVDGSATVNIKDVSFLNMVVRDTGDSSLAFGHSAVLFGRVEGKVCVENVTIEDCVIYGGGKTGTVIGYLPGEAELNNVTIKNTDIYGLAFVAKAVGAISDTSSGLKISNVTCTNVTTGVYEEKWMTMYNGDQNWITSSQITVADVQAYKSGSTNTYVPYERNSTKGFEPITTEDLFWTMVWKDDLVNYNGNNYRSEDSGNETWNPNSK